MGRSGRGRYLYCSLYGTKIDDSSPQAIVWAAAINKFEDENEGPFQKSLSEVEELLKNKYYPTDHLKKKVTLIVINGKGEATMKLGFNGATMKAGLIEDAEASKKLVLII